MLAPADPMAAMDCNSRSFRFADIMARVVCRYGGVGIANNAHTTECTGAIGARDTAIMKAHAGNYATHGFATAVPNKRYSRYQRDSLPRESNTR
jgi:seryl-tRNA(Sec) selenium transferase